MTQVEKKDSKKFNDSLSSHENSLNLTTEKLTHFSESNRLRSRPNHFIQHDREHFILIDISQ